RNIGDRRVCADIEEDLVGRQHARPAVVEAHLERFRRHEMPRPHDQLGAAVLVVPQVRGIWRSTMSRLRWRTFTMSIVTRPVFVPNSAACRATCATLALQISFLLGMQLTFGQEPPIQCRSTTAVRRPECARCQASSLPPAPLPRMSASNCAGAAMPSSKLEDASYQRRRAAVTLRMRTAKAMFQSSLIAGTPLEPTPSTGTPPFVANI